MQLLVELFYDLTCQDLPPDFEDNHARFFAPQTGLFLRFMTWDPPELRGDVSVMHISEPFLFTHCSFR